MRRATLIRAGPCCLHSRALPGDNREPVLPHRVGRDPLLNEVEAGLAEGAKQFALGERPAVSLRGSAIVFLHFPPFPADPGGGSRKGQQAARLEQRPEALEYVLLPGPRE